LIVDHVVINGQRHFLADIQIVELRRIDLKLAGFRIDREIDWPQIAGTDGHGIHIQIRTGIRVRGVLQQIDSRRGVVIGNGARIDRSGNHGRIVRAGNGDSYRGRRGCTAVILHVIGDYDLFGVVDIQVVEVGTRRKYDLIADNGNAALAGSDGNIRQC